MTNKVSPMKIIFDTDVGIDDAHALLILDGFSKAKVKVLAVTCVAGNVKVQQVVRNVSYMFNYCSLKEVPIYIGAHAPLISPLAPTCVRCHGEDGLGMVTNEQDISESNVDRSKGAVQVLIDLVKMYPNEITICAVGPLTNLALAERLWPEFSSHIKLLSIMGGNMHGVGNVTAAAEFNFYCDPEAAHIVLKDFMCPKIICPLELCIANGQPPEIYEEMFKLGTRKAKVLADIFHHSLSTKKMMGIYDQLAMACTIEPDTITKKVTYPCKVSLCGETRGQMIIDRNRCWGDFPITAEMTIIEVIDRNKFQALLLKSLMESGGVPDEKAGT